MAFLAGPETLLTGAVRRAARHTARGLPQDFSITVEQPENSVYGDYATNIALRLAPREKRPPMTIAEELAGRLAADRSLGRVADAIRIAAPGFINFSLARKWLEARVRDIAAENSASIRAQREKRREIQIEFISANPTGPLTLANGRGGFLGDTLANVLQAAGRGVTREYYVNDAGEQVRKLGASVLGAVGYQVPYSGDELYRGDYVRKLAQHLSIPAPRQGEEEASPTLIAHTAREASRLMLAEIKRVVRKAGIRFDSWFSERSLHRQGLVSETLKTLKRKRLVEERDGALWLKARELSGEDTLERDRVLIKSSGDPTYVLPDLAYHFEKFRRRRFRRVIDIVGADHHGHFRVLRTGLRALGFPVPEVIMVQFVRLTEQGREVSMSKRAGSFVTLEELLDDVGVDVARWFFLSRAPETHMDFDLALAREQSEKNPVHYVQYAHARCASILRKAEEGHHQSALAGKRKLARTGSGAAALHDSELSLMRALVRLPDFIARIAVTSEVHHLTSYATEVATAFSAFYRDCPVLSGDTATTQSRIVLVVAAKNVLRDTLALMGIRAPERM